MTPPTRRTLLRALPLLPFVPGLLAGCAAIPPPSTLNEADRAVVAQAETYLNGIHTLRARFIQVSGENAGSGTAWIERPGRLRLDYDPPSKISLVAARGWVVLANGATGATSRTPLARTPLAILLAPSIVLSGGVTVVSVQRGPAASAVTLRSTDHPGQGHMVLRFANAPFILSDLILVDGYGDTIELSLDDLRTGVTPDLGLFTLPTS